VYGVCIRSSLISGVQGPIWSNLMAAARWDILATGEAATGTVVAINEIQMPRGGLSYEGVGGIHAPRLFGAGALSDQRRLACSQQAGRVPAGCHSLQTKLSNRSGH
jgi:hypothetical protein